MNDLQLLIVADDPLARAGLVQILAQIPEANVVGQMNSRDLLQDWLDEESDDGLGDAPDVIIWDLGWEVSAKLPDWQTLPLPLVALLPDETAVADVWRSGVRAILLRDADAVSILATAQAAVHRLAVIDPLLADALLPVTGLPETAVVEELTPRETEVLPLLAEGLTNKAIAQRLSISDHTVKFHVNAIMTKLNAQSRTEAVVVATRMGLISL